jgi:glyceraldehyde 3-phosphate dehydrogenase
MARVAINGMGRIGRATMKVVLDTSDLELVGMNDLVPADNLVYLLRYDTVYTATQALVDGPGSKKDFRRGRAAAANLVPSSTGAAIATTKAVPQLSGRFDGVAVRAPVPVSSIADIVCVTSRDTSPEEVNDIFREEAGSDRYRGVLGVSDDPLVSSDVIADPRGSVLDLTLTQVVDGNLVKVMSWYDNEWGYVCQMVRYAAAQSRKPAAAR